jgi:hypothetical protein
MEALGAHPEIEAGFEELGSRRQLGPDGQIDFARGFFMRERPATVAAAGFKTKLQDVLDKDRFADLLREVGARAVLLQRRNTVKAVVSWFRSELVNEATGDWNVYRPEQRPPPVELDPAEFAARLARYEKARSALQEYALALERPALLLYYEDLLIDPSGTLDAACGFLGVRPAPVRGNAVKATPDDLRAAVSNFEELRERAGGRYHAMFDEAPAS